jgi:Tol biopolymer transport system component
MASRRAHLLTPNSGSDFRPAWSPDGKWIAFSSDRDSNAGHLPGRWELLQSLSVYVIRPDGSDLRRVTRGRGVAGSPRWSPDGKRIYYYETTELGAPGMRSLVMKRRARPRSFRSMSPKVASSSIRPAMASALRRSRCLTGLWVTLQL